MWIFKWNSSLFLNFISKSNSIEMINSLCAKNEQWMTFQRILGIFWMRFSENSKNSFKMPLVVHFYGYVVWNPNLCPIAEENASHHVGEQMFWKSCWCSSSSSNRKNNILLFTQTPSETNNILPKLWSQVLGLQSLVFAKLKLGRTQSFEFSIIVRFCSKGPV